MDTTGAIAAAVAALLGIGLILLRRYAAAADANLDLIDIARKKVAEALASKHYDDAAFWSRVLQSLLQDKAAATPATPLPPTTPPETLP